MDFKNMVARLFGLGAGGAPSGTPYAPPGGKFSSYVFPGVGNVPQVYPGGPGTRGSINQNQYPSWMTPPQVKQGL